MDRPILSLSYFTQASCASVWQRRETRTGGCRSGREERAGNALTQASAVMTALCDVPWRMLLGRDKDRDRPKHRRPEKRARTEAEKIAAAERAVAAAGALTRRAAPGQWAVPGAEPDSYFDSRADRDNLVFQVSLVG